MLNLAIFFTIVQLQRKLSNLISFKSLKLPTLNIVYKFIYKCFSFMLTDFGLAHPSIVSTRRKETKSVPDNKPEAVSRKQKSCDLDVSCSMISFINQLSLWIYIIYVCYLIIVLDKLYAFQFRWNCTFKFMSETYFTKHSRWA